jgi:hypothetical protein
MTQYGLLCLKMSETLKFSKVSVKYKIDGIYADYQLLDVRCD